MATSSLNMDSLKPHLLPITAALVVVATVPLAIMPWFSEAMDNYGELSEKEALLADLTVKADELERFDVAQSRDLLQNTAQVALPAEADPAGAIGTVEILARRVDASVSGVSYSGDASRRRDRNVNATSANASNAGAANQVTTENITATITLSGGYDSIANFIERSETALRVFKIDSFHISKQGEESEDLTAAFDISAPYLPHPTDLGPIETPFPQLTAVETGIIDRINSYNSANYNPTRVENITGRNNPF